MNEIIQIEDKEISIKEYRGQRVVTFKDIDLVHGRPDGTARRNFSANKNRFIEGEDYFAVSSDEIRTNHLFPIADNDFRDKALITEQGYLMLVKSFTDDLAWDVQRKLVNSYFRVKQAVDSRLSPETQLILQLAQSIADKELADKERDRKIALLEETANKAVETTEAIKEAVKPISDNWRDEIVSRVNRIVKKSDFKYQTLWGELYTQLDQRAGCDLSKRLRYKKERMTNEGWTKTAVNNTNKLDIINEDKKLREIFSKIVSEYEVRCA